MRPRGETLPSSPSQYSGSVCVQVHTDTRTHAHVCSPHVGVRATHIHTHAVSYEHPCTDVCFSRKHAHPHSRSAASWRSWPSPPPWRPRTLCLLWQQGPPLHPSVWEGRVPCGQSPNLRDYHLYTIGHKGPDLSGCSQGMPLPLLPANASSSKNDWWCVWKSW